MRAVLLSTVFAAWPLLLHAEPQCAIPAASAAAHSPAPLASPAPDRLPLPEGEPAAIDQLPGASLPAALRHVSDAGAHVTAIGEDHGLKAYVARSGLQFMILHATPDGDAVVAGMVTEMTPEQLIATAAGQSKELAAAHGLRSLFVTNGNQFQVFYATPDGQRVIAGAMWDASGHNLTRDAVSAIPGTVQVTGPATTTSASTSISEALPVLASSASAGVIGDPAAPKVWMFVDPLCPFSVRAMQELRPLVADRRLQVAVVPISINDHENDGRSTASALSMLSLPPDRIVQAWSDAHLDAAPSPDAPARLAANAAIATAVGLRGTPTLFWRQADGSEERSDGLPADLAAFAASVGR